MIPLQVDGIMWRYAWFDARTTHGNCYRHAEVVAACEAGEDFSSCSAEGRVSGYVLGEWWSHHCPLLVGLPVLPEQVDCALARSTPAFYGFPLH